jgi:hypothetical protein
MHELQQIPVRCAYKPWVYSEAKLHGSAVNVDDSSLPESQVIEFDEESLHV